MVEEDDFVRVFPAETQLFRRGKTTVVKFNTTKQLIIPQPKIKSEMYQNLKSTI